MSIENKIIQPDWTSLQDTTLEGGYELTSLLGAEEGKAIFKVRVLGDHLMRAQAYVYQGHPTAVESQIELWDRARGLSNKNLSTPLAAGSLKQGEFNLVYVLYPKPEETLDGVLGERALNRDEAADLLQNLISGLERLHAEGLVHGCVSPDQILAVGEYIQLSTTPIRQAEKTPPIEVAKPRYLAPESEGQNTGPAADVWCFGATLFESLTQKFCGDGCREEAAKLPPPFSTVIQRCLHPDPATRVRLPEVLALYKQRNAPQPVARVASTTEIKPPEPSAAQPAPAVKVAAAAAGAARKSGNTVPAVAYESNPEVTRPKPVLVPEPTPQPEVRPAVPVVDRTAPPARRTTPVASRQPATNWTEKSNNSLTRALIYGALGLVIFFGLLWLVRPKKQRPATPIRQAAANTASKGSSSNGAIVSKKSWETRTLSPDGTSQRSAQSAAPRQTAPASPKQLARRETPSAAAVTEASDAAKRTTGDKNVWRVIAYTYARQQDAANRAKAINSQHPELKAEEFSPNDQGGPYLVVLGGGLGSREDASQVRQRAITVGLPHDSYLQNFRR